MNMHQLIMANPIIRNSSMSIMFKVPRERVELRPTTFIRTLAYSVHENHHLMSTQHPTSRICNTLVLSIPANAIWSQVKTTIFQIRWRIILIIAMMNHQRHKILTAKMIFIIHNWVMMNTILNIKMARSVWCINTKPRLTGIPLLIRCTFKQQNKRVKRTIAELVKKKINCNLKTPCSKLQVDFL